MPLPSFDQLYQEAEALRQPVPVVAAGGADRTGLEALRTACDGRWVLPAVTGRETEVRAVADEAGIDLRGFTVIDAEEPAAAAVERVRRGESRVLMKGQIATPALMRAVLDPARGLRTGHVICQVVLMSVVPARRQFLLADTGVCVQPTLEQKIDILRSAVGVATPSASRSRARR